MAAAKRQQQQAGSGGVVASTAAAGKGRKKKAVPPISAAATTVAPLSSGKGRKRKGGKKTLKRGPQGTLTRQDYEIVLEEQIEYPRPQQQQQVDETLQALQPNVTSNRPTLRPPVPARKHIANRKANAGGNPSLLSPTPASRQHSFSSSASTLVASSNAGTPQFSPAPLETSPILQDHAFPKISRNIFKKPPIPSRPPLPHHDAIEPSNPDPILAELSSVLTSIDGETFSDNKESLSFQVESESSGVRNRGGFIRANNVADPTTNVAVTAAKQLQKKTNIFAKVCLYANARLPPNLPLFKV